MLVQYFEATHDLGKLWHEVCARRSTVDEECRHK